MHQHKCSSRRRWLVVVCDVKVDSGFGLKAWLAKTLYISPIQVVRVVSSDKQWVLGIATAAQTLLTLWRLARVSFIPANTIVELLAAVDTRRHHCCFLEEFFVSTTQGYSLLLRYTALYEAGLMRKFWEQLGAS